MLTDPDDMLTTGVEVEARPPGKKVKRLSLLSGGERSLVAVAFLVALFKARPSPFYILDEVEAALDDTNLGRLLEIYEELRENSPAAGDHPPEAHDGGRRRAVRRLDARRRRLRGDQPAAAGSRECLSRSPAHPGGLPGLAPATTRWADDDVYGHMNNARYFELIDTAVNAHLAEATGIDIRDPAGGRGGGRGVLPLLPRGRLPRAGRPGSGRRTARDLLGDLPDRDLPGPGRGARPPKGASSTSTCDNSGTVARRPPGAALDRDPEAIRAVVEPLVEARRQYLSPADRVGRLGPVDHDGSQRTVHAQPVLSGRTS